MDIQILPLVSKKEDNAHFWMLVALRQQGMGVKGLAQTSWTFTVGIELCNSDLKRTFHDCLDNPFAAWEMEELKILDSWDFI